ncbi:MAG: sugar-binding domain-containing protein [bacterium]
MATNVLLSGCCVVVSAVSLAAKPLSLAGEWRFKLDRADVGVQAAWFGTELPERVNLPGLLSAQGIGDPVTVETKWLGGIVDKAFFTAPEYAAYRKPGHVKVPFWLTPETYYAGVAWYQRDIEIPKAWKGQRVVLSLERPHWETRVWVDATCLGTNNSLAVPHDYDLGSLAPGRHTLTIRVDNRMVVDVGENSHSVSDHTQGNWNGVVGKIELHSTSPVWIDDVQVYPSLAKQNARVTVKIRNRSGKAGSGNLMVSVADQTSPGSDKPATPMPVLATWDNEGGRVEFEVAPQTPRPWDEFTPQLYTLGITLAGNEKTDRWTDSRTVTFGLREFTAQGTQFAINGRKTFMRGTLDCCIYPKTGHPPTDVAEWKRVIGVAKAHGLNLIRFHSWCPPEAAFIAADELGFYFHIEACSWANQSTTLGDGKPVDRWINEETERILKVYGNHPSFILMAYGNEPGGKNYKAYLAAWVNRCKAQDARRLFTSAAGWPELPENQWQCLIGPRIQGWGEGVKSVINAKPPQTLLDFRDIIQKRSVPVVSHEIGQWCVYPNFDEMKKYTGYLKPKNFDIFRDRLAARGMLDQARDFLLASGKLQVLCYKTDIEAALRTPGMAGFELLDLHDFPGQGTALVGVLDSFWEEKGYITPAAYSRFCNVTVPLARLAKRVFITGEKLEAEIEVAHFGAASLENAEVEWALRGSDGLPVVSGKLLPKTIPLGNGLALGRVSVNLDATTVRSPARYTLVVGISGTKFENDWDVWVYPANVETQPSPTVTVVNELNAAALAMLKAGGNVLLLVPPTHVRNTDTNKVVLGFSSIFWNTAWTKRQAPTTLGILCDPKHPALAQFPTDYHSDWQWWYLVTRAAPMILDDLPQTLRPLVQVIDDWVTTHKLALAFEARLGGGKLLVCSMDLQNDLDTNPVARQMRASLLAYMASPAFNPMVELAPQDIGRLTCEPPVAKSN